VNSKKWYTSKTIWVNLVALAGAVVVAYGLPEAQWPAIAGALLATLNLMLRLVTGESIAFGDE